MPKNISWRKLVHKFRKLGFDGPHAGGRHLLMDKDGLTVVIPNPHGYDISKKLVAEILRQAEISLEEWENV
jgi:predicted RNA binding protein YcfA (HicA-like mRNA interferase family)